MSFDRRLVSVALIVLLGAPPLSLVPHGAMAQIEEVVVTTRRREENLQNVPIAVDAFTAEDIERQGIRDLTDVVKLSPSVQFDTSFGPQDTRITVRGLSNTRGRSNVAFLVDGIDVTTENVISAGSGLLANRRLLNDVERIEVVKGPQSALYGRAAFAGAISYVTKEPGDEVETKISADVAEDGFYQVDGAFGGPVPGLQDVLGMRINGVYWSDDGHYTNSVSGNGVGGGEGYGVAWTTVFSPTESLFFKMRLEYSDDELEPTASVTIPGDTQVNYPKQALDAGLGSSAAFSGSAIGLVDHGVFCPDGVVTDEAAGPGYCLPKSYGDASGKQIRLSEDPFTSEDFEGTEIDLFRATLIASWDIKGGTLSSYTGYTDSNATQNYDQDYQASGRPDQIIAQQSAGTDQDTTQFSQELRFQSDLEGPFQFTLGGLYWNEERDLIDDNYIVACLPVIKNNDGTLSSPAAGVCDGTLAPFPTNSFSVSDWQSYVPQVFPRPPVPGFDGAQWNTETRHWSVYGMLEFELTESFNLTLEGRYVDEKFDIRRPNQASCAALGFAALRGGFVVPLQSEALNPGLDVNCEDVHTAIQKVSYGLDPNGPEILSDLLCRQRGPNGELDPNGAVICSPGDANYDQTLDWAFIEGTESSQFFTPKVTLEWLPTDSSLVYFSWARAQKPAGINQLTGGGTPSEIEGERFASEKMDAWEVGTKTSWQWAGAVQINGAVFYQDYTDKQVSTQVADNDQLKPQVLNASAAEVWGLELELLYRPDWFDGLSLSAAYTHLDSEYVDFFDDTALLYRAAATESCDVVIKGGSPFCRIDLSGNQLERTPENSFVGIVGLQRPLPSAAADWFVEMNATYQDERFVDADNFTRWDDYWLVDARLGLSTESWTFMFYVDNVFDDDTLKTGGSGPEFAQGVSELGFTAGLGVQQYFGTLPDPQTFGARFTVSF